MSLSFTLPVKIHSRADRGYVLLSTFQQVLWVPVFPPVSSNRSTETNDWRASPVSLPGLHVTVRVGHQEDVPVISSHFSPLPPPHQLLHITVPTHFLLTGLTLVTYERTAGPIHSLGWSPASSQNTSLSPHSTSQSFNNRIGLSSCVLPKTSS